MNTMKQSFKLLFVILLALGSFACSETEKKLTLDDVKAAEKTLMDENWTMNMDKASQVAETYCKFVEQNPNDSTAPTWLFHAMEINVNLKNADKCAELCNQLIDKYPESDWSPRSLILLGSYVYEDQLQDTALAHKAYQRLIDEYPNHHLVSDAEVLIKCLGLTDEEKLNLILMSQMEEED